MTTGIEEIRNQALGLGACDKAKDIGSVKEAVDMLLTPQGREFAMKTGFPTLDAWRANARDVKALGYVFLDSGKASWFNQDLIAVGNTDFELTLNGSGRLYKVIAMHGAKVTVTAKEYAVATVTSIDATVEVINEDGTAVITQEKA